MKQRKYVFVILVIVVVAIVALSASSVLARDLGRFDPPGEEHPPICTSKGYVLECYDVGMDITVVQVESFSEYDLDWDAEHVILRVYPENFSDVAYWFVQDGAGSAVSGRLP